MSKRLSVQLVGLFAILGGFVLCDVAVAKTPASSAADQDAGIISQFGRLPLHFEVNHGQAPSGVKAIARGERQAVLLGATETTVLLRNKKSQVGVHLKLEGASLDAAASFDHRLAGVANYYHGSDPASWQEDVATFERVRFSQIYPGVDVIHYANQSGELEHDFKIAAGANPQQIRIAIDSQCKLQLVDGDVEIMTMAGAIRLKRPAAYQMSSDKKIEVEAKYAIDGSRIGFSLGEYDRSLPLVIDPILSYSTFLGGSGDDKGEAIAVDSSGNVYVTGETASLDFPTASPGQAELGNANGITDVFIVKLNSTGTALVYSTYLGGSNLDYANGIAVTSTGEAWISGSTLSSDFPAVGNQLKTRAVQPYLRGIHNTNPYAYVAKIGSSGMIAFSSLITTGIAYGIAVDSSNSVYVSGMGGSDLSVTSTSFDKQNASNLIAGGAWFAKLTSAGVISYASHLAEGHPAPITSRTGIAVDSAGLVYVSGTVYETVGAPTQHAFVTRIDTSAGARLFQTTIGGSANTTGPYMALDSAGQAYVSGTTASGFQSTQNVTGTTCASGVYVAKLNSSGTVIYSTCGIGGPLAVDNAGFAYVAGKKLNPAGSTIEYDSGLMFTPGSITGETVDSSGNAYVTGWTANPNFTTTAGVLGPALKSSASDVFVSKITAQAALGQYPGIKLSALSLSFPTIDPGSTTSLSITVTNTGNANLAITGVTATGDYQQPTGCIGTVLPNTSCMVTVVFAPTVSGVRTGLLTISSNADGSPHTVALFGSATGLIANPGQVDFGSQFAFQKGKAVGISLVNTGASSLTISTIALVPPSTDYQLQLSGCTPPNFLQGGINDGCAMSVTPNPQGVGTRSATISVVSTAGTLSIPLTMSATGGIGITPLSLQFGNIAVSSSSASQAITVGNGTGVPFSLNVSLGDSTNYSMINNCTGTIGVGQTCTINVTFNPMSQGLFNAAITITEPVSSVSQTVTLTGAGNQAISLSTTSVIFPDQTVGVASIPQPIIVTNNTSLTLQIQFQAAGGSFSNATGTCNGVVQPQKNCVFNVIFTPSSVGPAPTGTLTVIAPTSPLFKVPVTLNGNGASAVMSLGTSPIIPNATVGQGSQGTVSLNNIGQSALTVTGITATGSAPAGVFTPTSDCPTTLAASSGCTITVKFAPNQATSFFGTLSVAFNGFGSPLTVAVSGTGTSAGAFSFSRVPMPFSMQPVGSTSSAQKAVLADSSAGSVTISSIVASGDYIQSNDCPTTMNNGGSCNIWISFRPSTAGTRTGTITVNSSAGTQTLNLSGAGLSTSSGFTRPKRPFRPN